MANEEYLKETFKPDKLWACPSVTESSFPNISSPCTEISNLLGTGVEITLKRGQYGFREIVNKNLLGQPGTYIINNKRIFMYSGVINNEYYFVNTLLYKDKYLQDWSDDLQMSGLKLAIKANSDGKKFYYITAADFHYSTPAYSETIAKIVEDLHLKYVNSAIITYTLKDKVISYTVTADFDLKDIDASIASIVDNYNDTALVLTPIISVRNNDGKTELYYYSYTYSSLDYTPDSGNGEVYYIKDVIPLNSAETTPVTITINETDMTKGVNTEQIQSYM